MDSTGFVGLKAVMGGIWWLFLTRSPSARSSSAGTHVFSILDGGKADDDDDEEDEDDN